MSLSLLCFGSLFCSVLCVPIWRNNTQKSALILLFAVIIISDMSSETNGQFLSDNSALEGASFFSLVVEVLQNKNKMNNTGLNS